ncbi:TM2 domain-containing 1, partial [Sigmodon hispidus]
MHGFDPQVLILCRNGYSYKVAVALSLFLGWLGADRFYLGYPALGLLKFCTVGFCGIGSLIDFILISMQIVGPSDGKKHSHIHKCFKRGTDFSLLDFNREP